jgi:hypothetical protein
VIRSIDLDLARSHQEQLRAIEARRRSDRTPSPERTPVRGTRGPVLQALWSR